MPTSPSSRLPQEYLTDNHATRINPQSTQPASRIRVLSSSKSVSPSVTQTYVPATATPRLTSPASPRASKDQYRAPIPTQRTAALPLASPPSLPASPLSSSPISLDMKRLLAKPAPPYARTRHGSGSESEGGGAYYSSTDGGKTTPIRFRRGKDRGTGTSSSGNQWDLHGMRELSFDKTPLDLSLDLHKTPSESSLLDLSISPRSRAKSESARGKRMPEQEKDREGKEKRTRNVLRRRPSTITISSPSPNPTLLPIHKSESRPVSALHSPLPPISPPSPLTPSMLPTGSSSPSTPPFIRATASAIGPKASSLLNLARSASALETSPVSRHNDPRSYTAKTREKSGIARLYDGHLKGFLSSPSSPTLSPTRSHSPAPSPQSYDPIPIVASSLSNAHLHSTAAHTPARTPNKHKSRSQPSLRQLTSRRSDSTTTTTRTTTTSDGRGLTPAAAVAAAYKKQASLREDLAPSSSSSSLVTATTTTVTSGPTATKSVSPVFEVTAAAAPAAEAKVERERDRDRLGRVGKSLDGGFWGGGPLRTSRSASGNLGGGANTKLSTTNGESGSSERIESITGSSSGHPRRVATDPVVTAATTSKNDNDNPTATSASSPYYTVFGSTSGRVVAVGGPNDHYGHLSWDVSPLSPSFGISSSLNSLGRRSTVTAASSGGGGGGGWKMPTRKRSGRLKRPSTGDPDATGESEGEQQQQQKVGRRGRLLSPSRAVDGGEEEGAATRGRKRLDIVSLGQGYRRSLRLSIDKFPEDTKGGFGRNVESGSGTTGSSPSGSPWHHRRLKSSAKESSSSPARTNSNSNPNSHNNNNTSDSPRGGGPPPASGTGNKIWKLMKRISTGGLRDRYTQQEVIVPPVPALPEHYSTHPSPPPRPPDDITDPSPIISPPQKPDATPKKTLRKKTSLVSGIGFNIIPTSPKSVEPQLPGPSAISYTVQQYTMRNGRPSTTTRSSSPNSSDVASTRFFSGSGSKQAASAHSSTSSLIVEDSVPPLPKRNKPSTGVAHHIIPPSELGRIHSNEGHDGAEGEITRPTRQQPQPQPFNPAPQWKSPSSARKLKLVVPPSPSQLKSPKDDDWIVIPTPALEAKSLPLPPPRRAAISANRIRTDTTTPTPNTSWSGASVVDLYSGGGADDDLEEERAWEQMWNGGDNNTNEMIDLTDDEEGKGGESPIIPSFSVEDPINAFPPKRTSSDTQRLHIHSPPSTTPSQHLVQDLSPQLKSSSSLEPPPRPSRSSQRPPPGNSKSTPTSPTTSSSPIVSHSPILLSRDNISSSDTKRISTGAQSTTSTVTITANLRRRSGSYLPGPSAGPTPRRALTFRELGRPKAGDVLTEQEKAARWDDLLEKSDEAGGTLHFNIGGRSGEHGLKSDTLRFSEVSSVNSVNI